LGQFLTPTSATWLPNQTHFAVSFREQKLSIYDAETGQEIQEINMPSDFGGNPPQMMRNQLN